MSKKVALLVRTTLISRVVVEVDDSFDNKTKRDLWYGDDSPIGEELANKVATQAAEKYREAIDCGIYDLIDDVTNDLSVPYDPEYDG